MAKLFIIALVALLACSAFGQTRVDDLQTRTNEFTIPTPTGSASRTTAQGVNSILGGEREIYIQGLPANCVQGDGLPSSFVSPGFWFVDQGSLCPADFELRLDGSQGASDDGASRDFDLNVNLFNQGQGMIVGVESDLDYQFTIELASSSGAVSSVTQQLTGSGGSANNVQQFDFLWDEFSGSADLSDIGAISLKFPGVVQRDARIVLWEFINPVGGIQGTIFNDCDCDGVQETGDTAVSGVVVTISNGADVSRTVTTDGNGFYSVSGLQTGTYTVTAQNLNFCSGTGVVSTTVPAGGVATVNFNVAVQGGNIICPVDTSAICNVPTITQSGDASVSAGQCDGQVSQATSSSDNFVTSDCPNTGVIGVVTRTFTAAGIGSCSQRITINDDPNGVVVVNAPADFTTSTDSNLCTSTPAQSVTGFGTTDGNDCTPVTISFNDETVDECNTGACAFSREIFRTFTGVDQCGNIGTSSRQRITCPTSVIDCPACPTCPSVPTCPTCPSCPDQVVPTALPVATAVPVTNPPTRNCRFICDDDDSSASALSMSVLALVALFALLF